MQVIQNAKERRKRGKGKNDIEKLIKESNQQASDMINMHEVYGKSPLDYIRNEMARLERQRDIDELSDIEEQERLRQKEEDIRQFAKDKERQLDSIIEDMFNENNEDNEDGVGFMFQDDNYGLDIESQFIFDKPES